MLKGKLISKEQIHTKTGKTFFKVQLQTDRDTIEGSWWSGDPGEIGREIEFSYKKKDNYTNIYPRKEDSSGELVKRIEKLEAVVKNHENALNRIFDKLRGPVDEGGHSG